MSKKPDYANAMREKIILRADPAKWMERAFSRPDGWQANILRDPASRIAILAPRQSGKSQSVASKVAHVAAYKKDLTGGPTTSLIAAPSERQSQLLLKKSKELLLKMGHTFSKDTQSEVILDGGGQIVALPTGSDAASTARGYTVSGLLVLDEFGFIKDIDEVLAVVAPMITVHKAGFFAISSASFEGDTWHQIVSGQRPAWKVYNIDVSECPRLTDDVLEDLRGELGPMRYAREVLNKFSVEGFSPISLEGFRSAASPGISLDPMSLIGMHDVHH